MNERKLEIINDNLYIIEKGMRNGDKVDVVEVIKLDEELLKELAKLLKPYLDSIPNCECGKKWKHSSI